MISHKIFNGELIFASGLEKIPLHKKQAVKFDTKIHLSSTEASTKQGGTDLSPIG